MTNGDVQNGDSDCDGFELMTIDKIINGKVRQTESVFVVFSFPHFLQSKFTLTFNLRCRVNGKHLMRLQSENAAFRFPRSCLDGV